MRHERPERRSPLGLGPLETAIMHVLWETDDWLTIKDIRGRMDYTPVGYTTVARVAGILHHKGLLIRRPGYQEGKPGPSAWGYRAAQPASEHIGELIATLLDHSPTPGQRLTTLWPRDWTRSKTRMATRTDPAPARETEREKTGDRLCQ